MRILFLSTWFPFPPDNGSKIRAYHLLHALGRSHQIALVAFHPAGGHSKTQSLGAGLDVTDIYPVPVDPFRYVTTPQLLKFASPIPLACWPSRIMRQTVARVISLGQWDAVVALQSPVARYALQLSGKPRILDVDTAYSYQAYQRSTHQRHPAERMRFLMSWKKTHQYEARLFRRFHVCTVVSPVELDYINAMVNPTRGRVKVLPNGVDCCHNQPGLAQPTPNALVFNGALTYDANYDAVQCFLADIYPLIHKRIPEASLTITGSTSGVDLAGLRLNESVHLSGYVDDVRPLVAGASACVVPIRQGGGTRLKILEAMALGTPVVSTSKGAEGLDVTPNRDILIADEPAEFAAQVLLILGNPDLRHRLATNARRLVERHYDWLRIGQRLVDLVESVAGRRLPL